MSAKYRKAITAPAAKAAFSGSACALSTERLVVKNPSKAKPCTKDQRCKGLGHLNFLGDFGKGPTAPAGSCSANKRPSRATAVNRKNTARGPSHCDKKAPPNKPSKGPTATMDWERPLRRLAPAGSAVISARREIFRAANDTPHSRRAISKPQKPASVAYPSVQRLAAVTASPQVRRLPFRIYNLAIQP